MNRQYFFFDMDGTLISPVMKKLLPSTVEAVENLQKQGHYVFLCTGRSYQMAMEYSDKLNVPGVIFCNGAGIAWEGELLDSTPMPRKAIHDLVAFSRRTCSGYQLLGFSGSYQNVIGNLLMNLAFPRYFKDLSEEQKKRRKTMVSISKYQGEDILKMDIFNLNKGIAKQFAADIPDGLQVFQTCGRHLFNAEVMAAGCTKAEGIRKVLAKFGGTKEDAWCFGDSVNDIEMMKYCGHAIAMGNAGKNVREVADYVTADANHDGIAKALKHFGLLTNDCEK